MSYKSQVPSSKKNTPADGGENPCNLKLETWGSRAISLALWSLFAMCVLLGIALAVFSLTWSAVRWVFWLPGRVLGLVR